MASNEGAPNEQESPRPESQTVKKPSNGFGDSNMAKFAFVGLLPLLVAFGYSAIGLAATTAPVRTTSGLVKGQVASDTSGVSEYLGIPYAQPPVGKLRWAPPQKFAGSSIIDATAFGKTCPATTSVTSASQLKSTGDVLIMPQGAEVLMSLLSQADVTYDEDCLTLNVWTKPQHGDKKKAVLLWIYGGGYTSGTTDNKGYNGKHLADLEDVVVVSVNYRVGVFGFPGNPTTRTNLGLLDQRLAVEWVRDNIAAFGGDPNRITLFGQSAGASSVDYFSYAWTEDPIVAGFIAESGTVFTPGTPKAADAVAKTWYGVTAAAGCGDANSNASAVFNCMLGLDWQTVQRATASNSSGLSSVTGGFGPSVDEIVVFSDYAARSVEGNLTKRPLLIGSNNEESGLFKVLLGLQNMTYPDAEWKFLEASLFTCAISERALASVYNKVPTWRYRYFGDFPNLQLSTLPVSGAWHGIETSTIFGTDLDVQNVVSRTEAQEKITTYMRKMWVAFAKDPVHGLTNYGLPTYNPLLPTLLKLAYNNQTGPNAGFPAQYDSGCVLDTLLMSALEAVGLM